MWRIRCTAPVVGHGRSGLGLHRDHEVGRADAGFAVSRGGSGIVSQPSSRWLTSTTCSHRVASGADATGILTPMLPTHHAGATEAGSRTRGDARPAGATP